VRILQFLINLVMDTVLLCAALFTTVVSTVSYVRR
jgi:hypothetical protein